MYIKCTEMQFREWMCQMYLFSAQVLRLLSLKLGAFRQLVDCVTGKRSTQSKWFCKCTLML